MRWHSDAALINGVIDTGGSGRIIGTLDFYRKSSRESAPMYKKLNSSAARESIVGSHGQKNSTQRDSISLAHVFTPGNNTLIDTMESKVFYQRTRVGDDTVSAQDIVTSSRWRSTGMETENPLENVSTFSNMNTKTYGLQSEITKDYGAQALNYGVNFSITDFSRPFEQVGADHPTLQPQGNNRTYDTNVWLSDTITIGALSVMPGLKYSWHKINPQGFEAPSDDKALGALTLAEINEIHGKTFTDGKLLPSLTVMYASKQGFNTYLQYKRGVSYPTSSQIAGIWLHPRIGRASPAMVGNSDLKSETSNQFELGVVGKAARGLTVRGNVFYNSYDNFIYNRKYALRDYQTGAPKPGVQSLLARLPASISSLTIAENRDKAYIYGAEVVTRIDYGALFGAGHGLSSTLPWDTTRANRNHRIRVMAGWNWTACCLSRPLHHWRGMILRTATARALPPPSSRASSRGSCPPEFPEQWQPLIRRIFRKVRKELPARTRIQHFRSDGLLQREEAPDSGDGGLQPHQPQILGIRQQ